MIFFIFYLIQAYAQITFDSGLYTGFQSSSNFLCKDGFSQTATISFNGQFNNIPQVILGLELLNFGIGIDYRLSIYQITTTYFVTLINCITSTEVFAVQFSWYAIDDQRIQVINNFNMENPDNKIFDHINPNVLSGILSITSLGIYGEIDFNVSISSINTTNVQVGIKKVTGKFENLKQIGYQVILGTSEAFLNYNINQLTTTYNSGTLTQQSNRWLFLSYTGFTMSTFLNEKVIRSLDPISYTIDTFDVPFVQCYHVRAWLAYKFTTVYKAFECPSVRLSQSYDKQVSTKPQINLEIWELNSQLVQSEYKLIDKLINSLTLKVYVKCENQKKIVSQFLRCQTCSTNQYHQITNYCSQVIDAVTYFTRYGSTLSVFKELNINIIQDRITITQVLYNQVKTTQIILDIQIVNQ